MSQGVGVWRPGASRSTTIPTCFVDGLAGCTCTRAKREGDNILYHFVGAITLAFHYRYSSIDGPLAYKKCKVCQSRRVKCRQDVQHDPCRLKFSTDLVELGGHGIHLSSGSTLFINTNRDVKFPTASIDCNGILCEGA